MNINYEKLIIYHCKNNHNYSIDLIKSIANNINIDDLLIIATIYNNYNIIEYALTLNITLAIKNKIFFKACNLNLLDIVKKYNEHDNFKYSYIIDNNQIYGNINIVAKIKNITFENNCCVCMEESNCKLNCNHELCIKCLKIIYYDSGLCPMCRNVIDFCYIIERFDM